MLPSGDLRPIPRSLSDATPYQLRALVLDYLLHQCYTKTARALVRDSTVRHLDADGNEIPTNEGLNIVLTELSEEHLRQVELREIIRVHILSGHVDVAVDILNKHFPFVLSEPIPERAQSTSVDDRVINSIEYASSTSVDPLHLTLNLRILSFVEACRSIPLQYPKTTPKYEAEGFSLGGEDSASSEQNSTLLSKAQKLLGLANTLPKPSDRTLYLRELNNVGGLLAYKVPEASSISRYLSQERREAVADQINRAILDRSGLPVVSALELLIRHTTTAWAYAHHAGVKIRPGAFLPPTSQQTSQKDQDIVPPFDLRHFVDLRT